ncbi:hypothetical protein [Candidatus Finniella inopinata]|uniref:Uncharacterized protein n=1 Tax=Candidatus Finniella inopinata TaxID=1696036 RepID=A0A4Q7DFA5_9PROT|nr:hypothetical protein [Candidatus Finniella inopinata]RZI45441.1 hypothetical protein EQU50_07065 [Candidatus Finniella inopinata]
MSSLASYFWRFSWLNLLCLIFFWGIDNPTHAFHIDWDDYHRSRSRDLTWYLHYLSAHEPTDNPESLTYQRRLEYKKSAIGYILATGGPNGFREEPATAEEEIILLKAASVAAFLHESLGGAGDFDLLSIRRSNGWDTETDRIKSHLLFVQKPLTATRVLIKAGQRLPESFLIQTIYGLYKNDCLPTLKLVLQDTPAAHVQAFAQTFTKDLANRLKVTFEDIMDPLSTTLAKTIPLICYSESCLQTYITKICLKDSPESSIQHKPLKVTLQNGLIVSREVDGSMILKSNRKVNLGKVSVFPTSFYRNSIILHSGPLLISKYQNEDELLASLEAVSAILTGDTRKNGYQTSAANIQRGYLYDEF